MNIIIVVLITLIVVFKNLVSHYYNYYYYFHTTIQKVQSKTNRSGQNYTQSVDNPVIIIIRHTTILDKYNNIK